MPTIWIRPNIRRKIKWLPSFRHQLTVIAFLPLPHLRKLAKDAGLTMGGVLSVFGYFWRQSWLDWTFRWSIWACFEEYCGMQNSGHVVSNIFRLNAGNVRLSGRTSLDNYKSEPFRVSTVIHVPPAPTRPKRDIITRGWMKPRRMKRSLKRHTFLFHRRDE
jgi:hypothetical protein